jgi:hypothetical protein
MTKYRICFAAICVLLSVQAIANDEKAAAIEASRTEAQTCKTAPSQTIEFELRPVAGEPASVPATPEELARVKSLLTKSGLPYDQINHRATYEFTLALVRVKNAAVFRMRPNDNADSQTVRECLTRLATDSGLVVTFE